jgi:hypothetical protein
MLLANHGPNLDAMCMAYRMSYEVSNFGSFFPFPITWRPTRDVLFTRIFLSLQKSSEMAVSQILLIGILCLSIDVN